jgi:hypothetical protein
MIEMLMSFTKDPQLTEVQAKHSSRLIEVKMSIKTKKNKRPKGDLRETLDERGENKYFIERYGR